MGNAAISNKLIQNYYVHSNYRNYTNRGLDNLSEINQITKALNSVIFTLNQYLEKVTTLEQNFYNDIGIEKMAQEKGWNVGSGDVEYRFKIYLAILRDLDKEYKGEKREEGEKLTEQQIAYIVINDLGRRRTKTAGKKSGNKAGTAFAYGWKDQITSGKIKANSLGELVKKAFRAQLIKEITRYLRTNDLKGYSPARIADIIMASYAEPNVPKIDFNGSDSLKKVKQIYGTKDVNNLSGGVGVIVEKFREAILEQSFNVLGAQTFDTEKLYYEFETGSGKMNNFQFTSDLVTEISTRQYGSQIKNLDEMLDKNKTRFRIFEQGFSKKSKLIESGEYGPEDIHNWQDFETRYTNSEVISDPKNLKLLGYILANSWWFSTGGYYENGWPPNSSSGTFVTVPFGDDDAMKKVKQIIGALSITVSMRGITDIVKPDGTIGHVRIETEKSNGTKTAVEKNIPPVFWRISGRFVVPTRHILTELIEFVKGQQDQIKKLKVGVAISGENGLYNDAVNFHSMKLAGLEGAKEAYKKGKGSKIIDKLYPEPILNVGSAKGKEILNYIRITQDLYLIKNQLARIFNME